MSTSVPLVMALDDPAAELAAVGGKGASLARLARARLPVPPGFHVTTQAYLDFVARHGLRDRILAATTDLDPDDTAALDAASAGVQELFAAPVVPAATVEAVGKAYAGLGGDGDAVVAVRSSATAEDLPDMSFAGQQDTYLDVTGEAAVLDAVRRCWASLWTARAVGYRARNGIAPDDVSLAVVVQQLVPADASGILFTADPVSGARDRVVVNAGWGLGEAVVGGQVTPDTAVVDRGSGDVDYQVGTKEVMTVRTGGGTHEEPVPEDLRDRPVLTREQTAELARVGVRIEELYGQPMDVEWARSGDELYVVQARPITSLAATEEWNDSLDGDYLWSNGNLGEAIPDVMTPATWSFVQLFMSRAMASTSVPGYLGYGRVGGRFYMNLSMAASLAYAFGIGKKRFVRLTEPVYGKLPADREIPTIPLSRPRILRLLLPVVVGVLKRAGVVKKKLPGYLTTAAQRCDDLRAKVEATDEPRALADLWDEELRPYFVEACDTLGAGARQDAAALVTVPRKLTEMLGETDANALLSGQQAGGAQLASLGPVVGMAQLARGEIDRDTYARLYGHRSVHEFEVSAPRPAEDPAWLDEQLAQVRDATRSADDLLAAQETARQAAWERLQRTMPGKVAEVRKQVARWAKVAGVREATRSEVIRAFWVARTWVLRAGSLTGHGDDLFFLSLDEILDVLRGDESALAAVEGRRATYDRYCALPRYPTLIRGRFDPDRWAADPDRRSDFYDEHGAARPVSDEVTGYAGASGVVEGTARLVERVEDGDRLGAGEILVTTVTNIGWTPIFPRAAAVVTDIGAPLSHAAIVARELGIPAVVGCGNAMMRLRSGDRVRVDGGAGTVEVLEQAPADDRRMLDAC